MVDLSFATNVHNVRSFNDAIRIFHVFFQIFIASLYLLLLLFFDDWVKIIHVHKCIYKRMRFRYTAYDNCILKLKSTYPPLLLLLDQNECILQYCLLVCLDFAFIASQFIRMCTSSSDFYVH